MSEKEPFDQNTLKVCIWNGWDLINLVYQNGIWSYAINNNNENNGFRKFWEKKAKRYVLILS